MLIGIVNSVHRIGSVVFIDTLSFMQFYPQSSVNNCKFCQTFVDKCHTPENEVSTMFLVLIYYVCHTIIL